MLSRGTTFWRFALTDELQRKATIAAKKSLRLKIIGQNALWERFMKV